MTSWWNDLVLWWPLQMKWPSERKWKCSLLRPVLLFATLWSICGIPQTRILEWVIIPFSRGSSRSRDWTPASYTAGRCSTVWTIRETPPKVEYDLIFFRKNNLAKALEKNTKCSPNCSYQEEIRKLHYLPFYLYNVYNFYNIIIYNKKKNSKNFFLIACFLRENLREKIAF